MGTMNIYRKERISRFLSRHLRHSPERLGLSLEPGGWVPISCLLSACAGQNLPMTLEELFEVVATNDKQRFSLDSEHNRIRANQGHSVDVDLQLVAQMPPSTLFHGTSHQAAAAIEAAGLLKMKRHHVHLSTDFRSAQSIGRRHGRPLVYQIDAFAMLRDGFHFYCTDNGVWLVETVPVRYLSRAQNPNRASAPASAQLRH